ncbi:hypothetical protein RHMOL_Rhmol11G0045700 [Rhododendron molle]|uniref:Uncharacterized protein n=1 Tax=Rhododendron molle TaxID=49168 RepID=A0ACC0LNE1_RHOML|nr:hypothetical protein RHMOL_Rhmol11G0045700 [Rhododendron molle]
MEEKYEPLKELGSGNFGVARLVRDKKSKELLAVKYIERGKKTFLADMINIAGSRCHWSDAVVDDDEDGWEIGRKRSFTSPKTGSKRRIDENVQREIINHRSLRHPNIVRFKEVSI